MRNDEDDIRHYMPVLRRIIILVAVLTAVPVMWTITVYVGRYVGPPKLPTFQRMTASTLRTAPDSAAPAPDTRSPRAPAAQQTTAAPLPAVVEARATTTDARSPVLVIRKPPVGGEPPDIDVNAPSGDARTAGATVALSPAVAAAPAPSAADTAGNVAAPSPVARPAASPAPNSTMQVADQQPPAANWPAADPLPPAEPIAGPVPLPRQRPRLFAMAQTGVPLPQPRPASAPPGTPSEETSFYPTDDRLLAH